MEELEAEPKSLPSLSSSRWLGCRTFTHCCQLSVPAVGASCRCQLLLPVHRTQVPLSVVPGSTYLSVPLFGLLFVHSDASSWGFEFYLRLPDADAKPIIDKHIKETGSNPLDRPRAAWLQMILCCQTWGTKAENPLGRALIRRSSGLGGGWLAVVVIRGLPISGRPLAHHASVLPCRCHVNAMPFAGV